MSEKKESLEVQVARIDERTSGMVDKLDKALEKNDERHASHSRRLGELEALKNQGKGALWILGLLWALLGGAIVKHLFWDLDRATPAASAAEVHTRAR